MADLDLTALRAKAEAGKKDRPAIGNITINGTPWFDVILALVDRVEKAEKDVKTLEDEMACFEEEERMADEQSEMDRRRLREQDDEIARLCSLLARAGEALRPFWEGANRMDESLSLRIHGVSCDQSILRTARTIAREIEEAIGHE